MTEESSSPSWPIPAAEITQIQESGRKAALAGQRPDTCPYRPGTDPADATERFRQLMWIRGYRTARAELEADRPTVSDNPRGDE